MKDKARYGSIHCQKRQSLKAKIWFCSALIAKYLPPAKVSKLRSDIMTFAQPNDESIHEVWERSKGVLNKAFNHRLP